MLDCFYAMVKARFLANAPLREAIIDLRAILPEDVDASSLADLGPGLAERYPTRENQMTVAGEIRVGGQKGFVARNSEPTHLGYVFRSGDGSQVAQFRTNGFTFSRLAPYTDWEQVFPEAMELWSRYMQLARPLEVVRVATRYVNDMHFSLPFELGDFLTAPPPQPPGIPDEVIGFLTQLAVRDPESGSKVNIIQTIGDRTQSEASIILDIDAFQDGLSIAPHDEAQLHERLQALRELKNDVFFKSITEAAARRFE